METTVELPSGAIARVGGIDAAAERAGDQRPARPDEPPDPGRDVPLARLPAPGDGTAHDRDALYRQGIAAGRHRPAGRRLCRRQRSADRAAWAASTASTARPAPRPSPQATAARPGSWSIDGHGKHPRPPDRASESPDACKTRVTMHAEGKPPNRFRRGAQASQPALPRAPGRRLSSRCWPCRWRDARRTAWRRGRHTPTIIASAIPSRLPMRRPISISSWAIMAAASIIARRRTSSSSWRTTAPTGEAPSSCSCRSARAAGARRRVSIRSRRAGLGGRAARADTDPDLFGARQAARLADPPELHQDAGQGAQPVRRLAAGSRGRSASSIPGRTSPTPISAAPTRRRLRTRSTIPLDFVRPRAEGRSTFRPPHEDRGRLRKAMDPSTTWKTAGGRRRGRGRRKQLINAASSSGADIDPDSAIIAPVPRISIQAFCETTGVAGLIEASAQDRRMDKAHLKVQMGGAARRRSRPTATRRRRT